MAQPIQVSPIQVGSGDGLEYLGQSISNIIKSKEARDRALREAVQKQKQVNNKIFGDSNELLMKFNDSASSMPINERDTIFSYGTRMLAQNINDPNYAQLAQKIVAEAYQAYNGWNDYFKKSDEAAKELSSKYGMDEKAIKSFAYKNIYDPKTNILKDPKSFGDVYSSVTSEVMSHPELYADQYKLTSSAYKDLDDIVGKPQIKSEKLELDPTGERVSKIGTKYSMSLFDKEDTRVDPITGLKYSKPSLSEYDYTGGVTNPKGGTYKILSDDKYEILNASGSPMIKQKLMIGAIEKIRDHNAEVFKKAGLGSPEELALSVSKNNASSFEDVKGFVNPFDESNMDLFQRIYASDFIRNSGRYDKNGNVIDFDIDKGVKRDRIRKEKTESEAKQSDYIKAYRNVSDIANKNMSERNRQFTGLSELPDYAQNIMLDEAKKSFGEKATVTDFQILKSGDELWLATAKPILDEDDKEKVAAGVPFKKLTREGIDVKASQPLGQKAKSAAVKGEQPTEKRKLKYNPNTGKYE